MKVIFVKWDSEKCLEICESSPFRRLSRESPHSMYRWHKQETQLSIGIQIHLTYKSPSAELRLSQFRDEFQM